MVTSMSPLISSG